MPNTPTASVPAHPVRLADGARALITGGAGFIGSHLAAALVARGCRVSVIDNLSTGRFENIRQLTLDAHFSFAIDSITNEAVLDHLVRDCDLIFHLASAVGVELIVADPVHVVESSIFGTRAVLAAANRYRKPVCITSSSEVYGKSDRVPFAEDDDLLLGPTSKGRWSYATSKAAIEHLSLAYHRQMDLPVTVVRLFNTVGPRQRGRYGMVVPRLVRQALAGEPLSVYGDGQQRRCFCDVTDVVDAMTTLVEHPGAVGGVFNVGSTHEVSILELAERILAQVADHRGVPVAAHPSRIAFVPYEEAYGPGFEDMSRRLPSTDRIASLIGWQPRISLDETLRKVIEERAGAATRTPSA